MTRIAIVEDEDLFADELTGYIQKYSSVRGIRFEVVRFRDGDEILEDYQGDFDIILMDIQMEFTDGMTAAEQIRKWDQDVVIIFITNMINYAIRGYQVDALDYVLKPISYQPFEQKLERALTRVKKRETHSISLNVYDGVRKMQVEDIFYVESEGHTLNYYTASGKFSGRGKMKEAEAQLVPYGFFRSNKGYLVNLHRVEGVKDGCCLIDGKELLISRARRNEFMEALSTEIGEY